jgi:hypothetical protein
MSDENKEMQGKQGAKNVKSKNYARNYRKRAEIRSFITNHLAENHCVDCGESDPVVLEFDHQRDKDFAISKAVPMRIGKKRLAAEIAKCVVRCANCHRRKTYRERGHRSRKKPD